MSARERYRYYVAQRPQQTGDAGPVRIPAEALDALVAGIAHLGERTLSGLPKLTPEQVREFVRAMLVRITVR